MARPVWQNESLGPIGGDYDPQYDIVSNEMTLTGAKLTLKNPITQEGTRHSADNMNNLFDIDNLDSMVGNSRKTVFNADGSITETITDAQNGRTNATRLTEFPNASTIKETTTIYNDMGTLVLRKSIITTTFNADGSITEVVS